MEHWEIVIVGAGASGLMAAYAAARERKAQGRPGNVLVVEGNPKPGKKLLATGNGRCNLSNLEAAVSHYHGDSSLAAPLLEAFPASRVLEEFQTMGLLCQADEEGRVYPRSLQAAAVLQVLRESCQELGVELRCGGGVTGLLRKGHAFQVQMEGQQSLTASRVILACGGKASPKHSYSQGGYGLAQGLGHSVSSLYPVLTGLRSPKKSLRSLKGMRVRCQASLFQEGTALYREGGEVLFGEAALSGICVFNLSAHLPQPVPQGVEVSLDLFPELSYREVLSYLERQVKDHPNRPGWELFSGALNLRVGEELAKEANIAREAVFSRLSRQQLRRAAGLSKDWRFPVSGVGDWTSAQVTGGGVSLREVNGLTMESQKCRGLYLTGELLNLHGDCGGYNLHWAWATGLAAGKAAGTGRKGKESC